MLGESRDSLEDHTSLGRKLLSGHSSFYDIPSFLSLLVDT
jgi:hypothetical protein